MVVVGEYARISDADDDLGGRFQSLGIDRQHEDTGALVRRRSWTGRQYKDDDKSAFKVNVVRPDFERMLADLEAGTIQGIVGYDIDRIFRQPSDLERAIRLYDRKPGLVFATVQGDIDLSTPDGRTMARVLVAFANKSSMDTARRVSRQKLARALAGNSTSNYRAFGWTDEGKLHPVESALLKDAIKNVLTDGFSLCYICDWLNEAGHTTVRGHAWRTSAMRRVLTAPRLAGYAVFQKEILTGTNGQPVRGNWEPLVDEETWQALSAVLEPRKGTYPQRTKKYLLSGIARCGLCGMGMTGFTKKDGSRGYMCRSRDSGGCAKISIDGPKLDDQIRDLVLAYTKDRIIEEPETGAFPGEARLAEVAEKIAELMEQYNSNQLSGGIVFPQVARLDEEKRQLLAERSKYTRQQRKATRISGEWPDWNLEERRLLIRSVLDGVVVAAIGRGGGYRPERVTPLWRELPARSTPIAQE